MSGSSYDVPSSGSVPVKRASVSSQLSPVSADRSRTVRPSSGVIVPQGGQPHGVTRSASSTPSRQSAGSIGVRSPAVSSASSRCTSASWACRRRMNPTVCSVHQVQAGVSGGDSASSRASPLLAVS